MAEISQLFISTHISVENRHEPIPLPHETTVILGRGPLTKLKDTRLSRQHLELKADCKLGVVNVKLVGANSGRAARNLLKRDSSTRLKNGDTLELLENLYAYKIQFEPDPPYPKASHVITEKALEELKRDGTPEEMSKQSTLNSFFGKRKREDSEKSISGADVKFFLKGSGGGKWEDVDGGNLLVYNASGVEGRSKIAAYDLDSTLITTKSGRVYPKGPDDWKLAYAEVPGTLKAFWRDGYKVVIITNQGGLSRGKTNVDDFRRKITSIIEKIGVPIQVFVATAKGIYRKPAPGVWNYLSEKGNDGVSIDKEASFFCGDAAGREEKWAPGKKKDHSLVDRLFAVNVGLKFYTPEEHFLKHKPAPHKMPQFNPSELPSSSGSLLEPSTATLTKNSQEVILLVGSPGSGKSYFANQYYSSQTGYVIINRDTLGTWQKCVAEMQSALSQGKSVVIDNTNPDKESRCRFVKAASARGIPVRCFVMKCDLLHAQHNNKFRELTDEKHEPISEMVFNIFRSKYEEPSPQEGYAEIVRVNFIPKFEDPKEEDLYRLYLLEK